MYAFQIFQVSSFLKQCWLYSCGVRSDNWRERFTRQHIIGENAPHNTLGKITGKRLPGLSIHPIWPQRDGESWKGLILFRCYSRAPDTFKIWSFFSPGEEGGLRKETSKVTDWFGWNSEITLGINLGCGLITTLFLRNNVYGSPAIRVWISLALCPDMIARRLSWW